MATKPITEYRWKNGKLVRVRPFRARIKEHKAARDAKAWAKAGRKTT